MKARSYAERTGPASGSSAAFAAAGALGLAGAAITSFSPLRHYDIRARAESLEEVEPAAEEEPAVG